MPGLLVLDCLSQHIPDPFRLCLQGGTFPQQPPVSCGQPNRRVTAYVEGVHAVQAWTPHDRQKISGKILSSMLQYTTEAPKGCCGDKRK